MKAVNALRSRIVHQRSSRGRRDAALAFGHEDLSRTVVFRLDSLKTPARCP